jgi:CRP/FNR family transcriptional regulator, anaerobic regulatory protein
VENKIKKYLQKYIELTEIEVQQFLELTVFKTIEKGEILLDFDKKCKYQFFIVDGLLISYSLNENGENKVIQISTENTWTGDLNSYTTDNLTNRLIRAYERTNLILLKKQNWENLLKLNCKYEKFFRIIFLNAYIQQTKRVESAMKYDSKTRLKNFLIDNPQLINRVQKKIIASYLDMTPETLSRLLKKHFT